MQTLKVYVTTELLRSGTSMQDMFESVADMMFERLEKHGPARALNPSAIIVDRKGLACEVDPDSDFYNPHYVSPEEIGGADPSFQTTIYNLGALFYFIATQSDPYGPYTVGSAPDAHFMHRLTDPHRINPELSREAAALIKKMMSESPGLRHKSVKSFQIDMDNVKRGEWPLNAPVEIDDEIVAVSAAPESESKAKKRVAISNERISEARRKQMRSLRKPRLGFLYFLLFIGMLYAAWEFHVKENWDEYKATILEYLPNLQWPSTPAVAPQERAVVQTPKTPEEEPARERASVPAAERPTPPPERQRQQPERESQASEQRPRSSRSGISWRDPDFLRAARIFNQAADRYTEYTQTVQAGYPNPRILDGVEDALRVAIDHFQICRPRAPEDVPVQEYIDRCYRLIASVRQSMLLERANPRPGDRR